MHEKTIIQPLHDKVLIKRDEPKKQIGSIHVPDTAQVSSSQGVVVAVGRGKFLDSGKLREPSVKVGDRVLIWGHFVEVPDHDGYVVVAEDAILGVFNDA